MPSRFGLVVASSTFAVLALGLATPAAADVAEPRPRENEVVKIEPPIAPPAEPEVKEAPPEEPKPEVKEASPEQPKPDAEAKVEQKAGNCSVDDGPERSLFGLALAVLLISGAALRRRG